jgi:hypothetical protein
MLGIERTSGHGCVRLFKPKNDFFSFFKKERRLKAS